MEAQHSHCHCISLAPWALGSGNLCLGAVSVCVNVQQEPEEPPGTAVGAMMVQSLDGAAVTV